MADVACMGEVLWDIFQIDRGDDFTRAIGGAIANVCVDLARVGARARLVGGIGRDSFGDDLEKRLKGEGVDTSGLVALPERTGIAFISRDHRGEPTFLFYRQVSADMAISPEHITEKMARAKWVLVGTSTLPRKHLADATYKFVRLAKKNEAGVLVDLNVRPHLWDSKKTMREESARLVKTADVVKGSVPDLEALGGWKFLEKHAKHALWIVTDADKPAVARFGEIEVERPALETKCIDATGGGDAFVAGILASLVRWKGSISDEHFLCEALDIGHELGKRAVSSVGACTGLVKLEKVKARLARLSER